MNDYSNLLNLLRSGQQRPSPSIPYPLNFLSPIKIKLSSPSLTSSAQRLFPARPKINPLLPTRIPIIRVTPTTEAGWIKRIREDIARITRRQFRLVKAQKIPEISEVAFDEAKLIQTSALHIDIRDSSSIINLCGHVNALKIYKIFHSSMVSIARSKGGRIRTFAGDRIAVFFDIDKLQRTKAVETALLMHATLEQIIKPIISQEFLYILEYGIGVDFGEMLVGRIGQSGESNNDLVWAGNAVNRASKLADDYGSGIFISADVYQNMIRSLKENVGMIWEPRKDLKVGAFYKFVGLPKSVI